MTDNDEGARVAWMTNHWHVAESGMCEADKVIVISSSNYSLLNHKLCWRGSVS